ncbi:MAG: LemA family protein [Clostridia bacterium]|nr:LemA family protein [Clostridia bacterium]
MNIGIIVAVVVVVLIILWVVLSYNNFIKKKNNVEEAFSTMDVYLKQRHDLIPNLVETVKGYAAHEKETLQGVIEARNAAEKAANVDDKVACENLVEKGLGRLFAIAENYPDLKANTNFVELQHSLQSLEMDIANARKYYNATVKSFNNRVEVFPSNILAGIFHFSKMSMFEVNDEAERENVEVQF